jgi:hypothetical protein
MSSPWTNLLWLHGHIRDPELVRRLANAPSPPPGGKRRRNHSPPAALASIAGAMPGKGSPPHTSRHR